MKKSFTLFVLIALFTASCAVTRRPDGYVACKGFNPPSQKNLKTAQTKRAKFFKKCQ